MRLLLDNCVINKFYEDNTTFSLLKELKEFADADFFICYSVIEEISNVPDDKKEKRIVMLDRLFSLEPKVLSDNPAVFDKTRFDFSSFSDDEVYQKVLELNKGGVRDAIHAQTAVTNGLILVTEDKGLYNAMKSLGYDAYNLTELRDGKQIMREIYPVLKQEYKNGFVCYFDILGFGAFSSKEENFEIIKKLVANLQGLIRMNNLNHLIGKITFFSDSIFFTVEDNELRDYMFFTSIIDFVCTARDIIQEHIGTDIRAGVSYGKYIHLKSGEIYGPAIVQSVKLGEHKKEESPLSSYLEGDPAAIVIHENVFSSPANKFGSLLRLFKSHPERYKQINETNFFAVNPYYFIYETKWYGYAFEEKIMDKHQICTHWRQIIDSNVNHKEKYRLASKFLDEFENDRSVK